MSDSIRKVVEDTEKSFKEKEKSEQIKIIKEIVRRTFEKIAEKEKMKKELQKEINILKNDINDLKEGRIDKIEERQNVDEKAKNVSIIIIKEKIIETQVSPWYIPYVIEIKPPIIIPCSPWPYTQTTWWGTNDNQLNSSETWIIDNSTAKNYTGGTYKLSNGEIKYL